MFPNRANVLPPVIPDGFQFLPELQILRFLAVVAASGYFVLTSHAGSVFIHK
jgi:hypothetical protein